MYLKSSSGWRGPVLKGNLSVESGEMQNNPETMQREEENREKAVAVGWKWEAFLGKGLCCFSPLNRNKDIPQNWVLYSFGCAGPFPLPQSCLQ